jgi:hypothetical protein
MHAEESYSNGRMRSVEQFPSGKSTAYLRDWAANKQRPMACKRFQPSAGKPKAIIRALSPPPDDFP